jgi:signal transduction histidine kinase
MRRRLIIGALISVLLTGVLIGVPLVIASDVGLRQAAQESATFSAERTVAVLELRIEQGEPNDREALTPYFVAPRQVSITFLETGATDVYGPLPDGPTATGSASGDNVEVTVVEGVDSIGSQQAIAFRIAATTALAMLIAFLVARRRARRIADELEALAVEAERIGSGDTRPASSYPWPEIDKIARALDASSARVEEVIRRERSVVADVTHQLRTPLTAISLRLEEIAESSDLRTAHEEAQIAQEQVMRLSGVIEDLLTASRDREATREPIELDEVLARQAQEWEPVFAAAGRRLVLPDPSGRRVLASSGALGQVLAILLENASVHGAGTVTLAVREGAAGWVVEVSDEGPGIPAQLGYRVFDRRVSGGEGSGLGLSLARALTEHMGGRLELVSAEPTTFGVFLVPATATLDSLLVDGAGNGDQGADAVVRDAAAAGLQDGLSGDAAVTTGGVGSPALLSGNTQRR